MDWIHVAQEMIQFYVPFRTCTNSHNFGFQLRDIFTSMLTIFAYNRLIRFQDLLHILQTPPTPKENYLFLSLHFLTYRRISQLQTFLSKYRFLKCLNDTLTQHGIDPIMYYIDLLRHYGLHCLFITLSMH
jgi:hypothetical protein